jgi:hypothetical protein
MDENMTATGFFIAAIIFATLAVLVSGLVVMAIGGKINRKYSNRLMVLRVVCQGIALLSLALLALSR